jgi:hypothetical protein
MFGKKKSANDLDENVAMRIIGGGKTRDVSYRELLLSTNLTIESLISLLVKKKLISPEDLLQEIQKFQKLRSDPQGSPDKNLSKKADEKQNGV